MEEIRNHNSSGYCGKRILLTGGSGFIGRNILESFLAEKYEITAPKSFELNLTDTNCVDAFFKDKEFDVVLHSGTKPGHRNAKDLNDICYSNLRMFQNLERHKDKYAKFINFGSGAIYDTSKDITDAKEKDIFKHFGKDEHGFCKYLIAKQIENLDGFVDLNIFGIFGKYEDYAIRFISNAICKTLFDMPVTLRQNRRFSYLYINDLMPVLAFFIENTPKYKSYNVVPDEKAELLDLAQMINQMNAKNPGIKLAGEGYGLDYTGDNSRLKKEFVNVKFTKIEQAVFELYNYYYKKKKSIDVSLLKEDK